MVIGEREKGNIYTRNTEIESLIELLVLVRGKFRVLYIYYVECQIA